MINFELGGDNGDGVITVGFWTDVEVSARPTSLSQDDEKITRLAHP